MFEFSIAIPAHDRGENGPKWMGELLDSLEKQTFQDFEVVVSDQSKNDNIMNVCKEYDFQFTYIKYQGDVPCENINIALNHCEGRIIKPTYHPVLPISYYEESLSKFPSDLPVIVFSDEPAWCHEQKFFEDDRFLISDSGDNITDMCLMSMCQYQIMANSTYSWWGAWLSNSKDVIAPRLWFGPDGQDPRDVYVDRWEYLDV